MKYADTNIQLYTQLLESGYCEEDLARVYRAYEYAMNVFTCIYHRCGDTFINHLVRTASILASLRCEPDLVVAGLVHSVYRTDHFGTFAKRVGDSKRKELRSIIGEQAEEYVSSFTRLDWRPPVIRELSRRLPQLPDLDRKMILIRLANELEEFLDHGIFYCSNADLRVRGVKVLGPTLVRMADDLGYPDLAAELKRVFAETLDGSIPSFFRNDKEIFYTINPRTLSPDRLPLLQDAVIRQFQRIRSAVRLRTRIRNFIATHRAAANHGKRFSTGHKNPSLPGTFIQQEKEPTVTHDQALLAGKNILLTGVGPNIGRSIAIEMLKQGAHVYFTDVLEQRCSKLEQELRELRCEGRIKWFAADVSNKERVEELCSWLTEQHIEIDILVNNVGIVWEKRGLRNFSLKEWEKIFHTNLFGPLYLTHLITERMIQKGIAGSILFLSSVHQWTIYGEPSYSASKAALGMTIKELALELAPHGIRVNGIAPGWVEEDETGNQLAFPPHRLWGVSIHPCFIGRAAVYLSSDYFSKFTTGTVLQIDSGLTLFNPQEGLWQK